MNSLRENLAAWLIIYRQFGWERQLFPKVWHLYSILIRVKMIQVNVRRDLLAARISCVMQNFFDTSMVLKWLTTLQTQNTSQTADLKTVWWFSIYLKGERQETDSLVKMPTGWEGLCLIYYFNCLVVLRECLIKVPGEVFKGEKINIGKCFIYSL